MEFVDRVHGTGFQEIRPWRPHLAIPVEIVDVVAGTDSSVYISDPTNIPFSFDNARCFAKYLKEASL